MPTLSRRQFLTTAAAGAAGFLIGPSMTPSPYKRWATTVRGVIPARKLGWTLVHEHILVDFAGADKTEPSNYDLDEIFNTMLPHLRALKAAGCDTLVECTPAYLGRSPALLKRLSEATGLHILTNTGYYGAVGHKYLPAHAETETARQLADRWLKEWRLGIDDTGIRPGFLKVSVDKAPLSSLQRKILEAAALTHLESGLQIAAHTGDGPAALEELDILRENGVSPEAFVWIHAQNETDMEFHSKVARIGAWVEFDGLNANYMQPDTVQRHFDLLAGMKKENLLHRTLLSQDAGWYNIGDPGGGTIAPYTYLFTDFIPALRKRGFSRKDIRLLMKKNPQQAFSKQGNFLARVW